MEMKNRWILFSLIAGAVAMVPAVLSAQPKAKQKRELDPQLYNEELTPGQIERAQDTDPPSDTRPAQKAPPPKAKQPPTPARAVACSGAFAKDSSHLKLAAAYKSENVDFTEIESGGTKLNVSVLFPKDPKRRLEVWWQNEAARQGIHLIVFNGQTTWTAPQGLRLSLPLAGIERLNGKPVKIKGLDKDGTAAVSDWQGGKLAALAGGCKAGLYLRPDPKVSADVRDQIAGDKEFASSDAAVKAVKLTISEMLIGY
jgi:hypothetical protein